MSAQNAENLALSPLVRKMSALAQPPLSVRILHKFKKPEFFAPKSADVRIWRTSLVREVFALDKPLPFDCGRLLWTAP